MKAAEELLQDKSLAENAKQEILEMRTKLSVPLKHEGDTNFREV